MIDFDALRELAKGRIPKEDVVGYRTNPETHTVFPITAEQEAAHPVRDIEKHKEILRSVASHVSGERGGDYRHTDRMAAKVLGAEEVARMAKERGHEGRASELETPEQAEAKKRKARLEELDAKIAEIHAAVEHPAYHAMAKRIADDSEDEIQDSIKRHEMHTGAPIHPFDEAAIRKHQLYQGYRSAAHLKDTMDSRDPVKLLNQLHSGNKASRRAFEQYTGVALGGSDATTKAGVLKYLGEDAAQQLRDSEARAEKDRADKKAREAKDAVERKLSNAKVQHDGAVKSKAEWIRDLIKAGHHYPTDANAGVVKAIDVSDANGTSYRLKGDERAFYLDELEKAKQRGDVGEAPPEIAKALALTNYANAMNRLDEARKKAIGDTMYHYDSTKRPEALAAIAKERADVTMAAQARFRELGEPAAAEYPAATALAHRQAKTIADFNTETAKLERDAVKTKSISQRVAINQSLYDRRAQLERIKAAHAQELNAMRNSGRADAHEPAAPLVALGTPGDIMFSRAVRSGAISEADLPRIKQRGAELMREWNEDSVATGVAGALQELMAERKQAKVTPPPAPKQPVEPVATVPRAASVAPVDASPLAEIEDSDKLYFHGPKDTKSFPHSRAIMAHALQEKLNAPHRSQAIDSILPKDVSQMTGAELHDLAKRITATAKMSDADIAAGKHTENLPRHFGSDAELYKVQSVKETPKFMPDAKQVHSLAEGAKKSAHAVAPEKTRYGLEHRLLEADDEGARYVATNGHSMTIVPVDKAEAVKRLAEHGETIPGHRGRLAALDRAKSDSGSRDADVFPDYKHVIPRDDARHAAAVDTATLGSIAKAVRGMATEESFNPGVKLTARDGELFATAKGKQHEVKVGSAPKTWENGDHVMLSASLLHKALKGRKGASEIQVLPPQRGRNADKYTTSPVVMKHSDGVKDVIMPMRGE